VVIEVPIGGEPIKYEMTRRAARWSSTVSSTLRCVIRQLRLHSPYAFRRRRPLRRHRRQHPRDRARRCHALPACRRAAHEDEAGNDEKLIAVPSPKLTQRYEKVRNYTDLPEITLQQIEHFFAHYKDLEDGKWVNIVGWGDAAEAHKLVLEGIARAREGKAKG